MGRTRVIFSAAYRRGNEVEYISTDQWRDLPANNLLWVDVIIGSLTHKLLGADVYWVEGNQYGMVYDGSCCHSGYASWEVMDRIIRIDTPPPEGAHKVFGVMVPDAQWERMRAH